MKRLLTLSFAIILLSFAACKNDSKNNSQSKDSTITNVDSVKQKTNDKGIEFTAKFICPAHCVGSGSNTKGVCPVCGMDYIENPDYKGN